ncbi:hypothetical protein D3C80_1096490 [compost metagenome]
MRVNRANLCLFDRQLSGCGIQILAGNRLRFGQRLLATERDLCKFTFRFGLTPLSAQFHERGFYFANLVFCLLRIDNPQKLAFFDFVTNLNRECFQLTTHLRADINFAQRVQLSGCQHVLLQLTRSNNQRLVLRHRRVENLPKPETTDEYHHCQQKIELPAFSLKVHKYSK